MNFTTPQEAVKLIIPLLTEAGGLAPSRLSICSGVPVMICSSPYCSALTGLLGLKVMPTPELFILRSPPWLLQGELALIYLKFFLYLLAYSHVFSLLPFHLRHHQASKAPLSWYITILWSWAILFSWIFKPWVLIFLFFLVWFDSSIQSFRIFKSSLIITA